MKDSKIIVAAVIVGLALLVLAHALSRVAVEIAKANQESSQLVQRLEDLSNDVPRIADEAGELAGRSAVNGAIDQAISEPLEMVRSVSESFRRPGPKTTKDTSSSEVPENPYPTESLIKIEFIEPSVVFEIGTDPSKFIRWDFKGGEPDDSSSSTDSLPAESNAASSLADTQD